MSESLFRRIQMMLGRGRVTYVDDSGPVQKMQVRANGLVTSDARTRLPEFGHASNPPVGSDVFYGAISGDSSNVAVVGTNHQESRPRNLLPGESMLYSQDGKYVYMTSEGGISVFANGQPVNVTGATIVTITAADEVVMNTPLLKCSGDILDNYETNSRTVAGMRTVANGHTHKVPNVQGGSSTVESDPPDQDE
jgi:phage baseplate assembly protein V